MIENELNELLEEWQQNLRLQDWQVRARFVRYHELPVVDVAGRCVMKPTLKKAVILLVQPDDFPPNQDFPQDVEETLVHELLHLHSHALDDPAGSAEDTCLEQGIDLLAHALVDLKRRSIL